MVTVSYRMDISFNSSSTLAKEIADKSCQVFTYDVLSQKIAKSQHIKRINLSRKILLKAEKDKTKPFKNINYKPETCPIPDKEFRLKVNNENCVKSFLTNCKRKNSISLFI